ncbi:MAG TPA: glycosyltransferase [Thermoanaerobaculia bacterium]|nr:glycosyltransferase [Thermoanaerobaculia bacterium]
MTPTTARADLHVHSKASNRPPEWILRQFGAPESFTEPREVYRLCRERGMDFVTLSDHDTIAGALEIAHLPGTFLSEEVTVEFPEDGCEIHCLAIGITEAQHRDIQALRRNVYELRDYLVAQDVVHAVAHPLYRVNDMLTLDQFEKLLVLFNRFEALNGIHDRRLNELARRLLAALTPDVIADLAERHRLTPAGPTPWIKAFTGGSDDHGGHYVATTWTETTAGAVDGTAGFLAALRAGHHQPGGQTGSSLRLAHSLTSLAHEYYRRQFPLGLGSRKDPFGELLRNLALGGGGAHAAGAANAAHAVDTADTADTADVAHVAHVAKTTGELPAGEPGDADGTPDLDATGTRRSHRARGFVAQLRGLAGGRGAAVPAPDRAAFAAANLASQQVASTLMRDFVRHARRGRLAESLGAAAAQLAPLAVTLAPFLVALQTQHKDTDLLDAAARRFLGTDAPAGAAGAPASAGGKKAWFTDTLTDVNGVAKTVRTLAGLARRRGKRLVAITCGEDTPPPDLAVRDFKPFAQFPIPGYESQTLALPPLLEVLEHCEREGYSEILISTPGPLGLVGLAAGKLLGIPVTGIYHTDFPLYVRHLAGSAMLEELTWTYMRWFFGSMERVFVASRCYLDLLAEHGLDRARMSLLPRGVDADFFHPGKREPRFYRRFGIDAAAFKFLYVGRVSREKNLDALMASFLAFLDSGRQAQLVVVGDGPYLKELARRHRRPEILFTGFLHGEDLARAYAGADLFVFPSTTDTFGNVVLEAQAAGLPAIVSDRGGPQEIVLPGGSGLVVDAGDPAALTAAMIRLFEEPALLAEMSARAVDNARRHSWDLLLERLYQSPTSPTPPTPATPAKAARPSPPPAALELQTTIAEWHHRQS